MKTLTQQRARRASLESLLAEHAALLARGGTVVITWNTRHGRRCGPYYHLRFRRAGRQVSVYLGRDQELAAFVRAELERLQRPLRARRESARRWAASRATLRQLKQAWRNDLAALDLSLHGNEVRGWRRTTAG